MSPKLRNFYSLTGIGRSSVRRMLRSINKPEIKTFAGFSLLEVLISMVIIGILGVISLAIFSSSLNTSSDTQDISKLKQNGEVAIKTLEEAIRNAEAVVCYGQAAGNPGRNDRIVIRTAAGKFTRFRFVDPVPPPPTPPTQNGYIARLDNLNPADLATFCTSTPSTSGEVALTNADLVSGVSITYGQFTKISGNLNKDTISVTFNVNTTKTVGMFSSDAITIRTTIQVR